MNRADLRRKKRRGGFTLVEVIVVLVILAILAAIIVPQMQGWIQKAKEKRVIVSCRACVLAAQTLVTEAYAERTGTENAWGSEGSYLFAYDAAPQYTKVNGKDVLVTR